MTVLDVENAFSQRLERFGELGAKFKCDLGDDRLFVDGTRKPATMNHEDGDPNCTLVISADDLLDILNGKLDPTLAFMNGKLKIQGDTAIAMRLAQLLK